MNIEFKKVSGSRNFSLAPIGRAWDATAAVNRVRRWASSDGSGNKDKMRWSRYGSAFGYTNSDEADNFGGYKLPFVDIIGGEPKAVFRALTAAIAVLNGARGGVDIPDTDRRGVYNLISSYYKKFDREPPELRSEEEYMEKDAETYLDFPFEIKANNVMENGTFEGYASTFGGNPDSHGDIIAPGAFSETIQHGGRNRNGIAMLWYHNPKEPIGVWESIIEDSKGLKVRGILDLEVQRARELHSLMRKGAIKGLSIGWDWYRSSKGDIKKDSYEIVENGVTRTRLLKQLELWEISPVTFPSNKRAKVTRVKSVTSANTEREMEEALRESGLSKNEALYVVKLCRPSLRDLENGDGGENPELDGEKSGTDLSPILNKLKEVNSGLKIYNSFHIK